MKNVLLIDGNSILNRAFYGIRPLTTKSGLYTHAVYGMINIILKNLDRIKPDYAAVAFDLPAPTFRHLRYDGYKASRKGMPEELAVQLPYAKKCMEGLGIVLSELAGYEADDILGTLASYSESDSELHTYILTGDKDSLQLIRDNVHVLLASTGETADMDRAKFTEKYGVKPEQFVDVKALMGDSSDNIPGVPGIGEKTALKLIAEYGSVRELYEELDRNPGGNEVIKGANLRKLTEGRESAFMSLELAKIYTEVPLPLTLDKIKYDGFNRPLLTSLLSELELFTLIKRLGLGGDNPDGAQHAETAKSGDGESSAETLGLSGIENMTKQEPARDVLIVEGEAVPHGREYMSVSFDGTELYVYDGDVITRFSDCGDDILRELFGDSVKKLAVLDSKELYKHLEKRGIDCSAELFDVTLAAYVLDPAANGYPIDRLAGAYLGDAVGGTEEIAGVLSAIYRLVPVLTGKLEERGEFKLYRDIEQPLAEVLASMEEIGFKIDTAGLSEYGEQLRAQAKKYESMIYDMAGEEFNIQSPKQLSEILFVKLGLPAKKKTKTGFSTDAATLEKLSLYYPIVNLILEYRQVSKLITTYVDGLLKVADENERVHTSFKQTVTATGRLSSTDPNLQNIPIRTPMGRELRKYFRASDSEHVLVDADYSQIELRLLAAVSGDENMIASFREGTDIHTRTAAQIFGTEEKDVTSEQRKRAKAVNFGIMYGIGDFSLAQDIKVSRAEAGEYIKNYFATFPAVRQYLDRTIKEARDNGYVSTVFGRRRAIPELSSPKKAMQAFGERVAMNSPIQGAAADIIKIAMINTYRRLKKSGADAKLILQVHDELIIECLRKDADAISEILRSEMENAVSLAVPLTVDVGVGDTWHDC